MKDLSYLTTGRISDISYSKCFYFIKNDENKTKTVNTKKNKIQELPLNKSIERLFLMNDKQNQKKFIYE